MKKIFCFLIQGLVLISLFIGCTPASPTMAPITALPSKAPTELPVQTATQEPIHLKVNVRNFISYAPLFIARDEGFFAEQGLNVELIDSATSSNEMITALIAREIDVATPTLSVSVFNAILQGNNLKYAADKGFLDPDNCTTDAFVASKSILASENLTDLSSIKGKNVVILSPAGTVEYSLDILLAQNGLTQNDIQLSNISDSATRVEGLNNGSIDITLLSEPWITHAQTIGAGEVWVPLSDILPNLSIGTITFGASILEDKPEAGTRFMIAYLKGVEQFNQGKTDRNIEIIANFTKLSPEDIKASCWTSFKPDGTMDTESMLAFQDWAIEKGYADGLLELDQFWTSQFVDEALEKLNQ